MSDNSSNKSFMKQLKVVVSDLYEYGVGMREEPKGRTARKELPKDIMNFLVRFVDLVMNTTMLSEETKMYISDEYITYAGVCGRLEDITSKQYNAHTVQTKIWYDKRKIVKFFGEAMFTNLIELVEIDKLPEYNRALDDAYENYGQTKLWANLALHLPETTVEEEDARVSDDDFMDFIALVGPYNRKHIAFVEKSIDKYTVGYCKRLLKTNELSEQEKGHKEMLLQLLKG